MPSEFDDIDEKDLAGQSFPDEGQYLLMVSNVEEKDQLTEFELTVCSGTVDGQAGRKLTEAWFHDVSTNKDGGKFARSRKLKLLLATGIFASIEEARSGKPYEPDQLLYRCFKAGVTHRTYTKKSGGTGRQGQIDGLYIWAPNDPDAAHIPADKVTLDLCRENGQQNAVDPSGQQTAGSGAAASAANQTTGQTAVSKPAAGSDDVPAAPAAKAKPADKYAGL
jgi:hypothetical protein